MEKEKSSRYQMAPPSTTTTTSRILHDSTNVRANDVSPEKASCSFRKETPKQSSNRSGPVVARPISCTTPNNLSMYKSQTPVTSKATACKESSTTKTKTTPQRQSKGQSGNPGRRSSPTGSSTTSAAKRTTIHIKSKISSCWR